MSAVVRPQSVPSWVSVVLFEETEVRCAERWASVPVDKEVRLLARVACPAGVTGCEDCVVVPGAVGTLSPSDSDSVGHDGPDGTMTSSDPAGILFPALPAGIPFPVGPVGPVKLMGRCPHPTLPEYCFRPFLLGYRSRQTLWALMGHCPHPILPECCFRAFLLGCCSQQALLALWALMGRCAHPFLPEYCFRPFLLGYRSQQALLGCCPRLTLTLLALSALLGRCPCLIMWEYCPRPFLLVSRLQWTLIVPPPPPPPGGLVPAVWTEFPEWKDPVVTQLPAELPVWDPGNVVDMDMTMDVRQAIPDVLDSRAVVAMVGIDMAQMGEDAPMDCDSDCAERDILNEFETVDGMPVYYGGGCYDSDWEDPRDLAYVDWVDFNAPEEYGVDLPDMEDIGLPKAANATVMMVGEVASPGHASQDLSSYSLPAADMVITEPVADILIVGRDIPVVAESPDHRNTFDPDLPNTFETVCGMPVYYGGDLNDSDCESVGDHDLDISPRYRRCKAADYI